MMIHCNVWLQKDTDVEDADHATITIELDGGKVVTIRDATVRVKTFGPRKFLMIDGVLDAN
jgi:hypothetical protein